MFCSNCGNQLADDARFCSKCGKAVAGGGPAPATASTVEHEQFHELVKAGREYSTNGQRILAQYMKFSKDQWLDQAEASYAKAVAIMGQIDELVHANALSPEGRWAILSKEIDYQRLVVQTVTGMATVDFYRKRFAQAVERLQRLLNETLPKDSIFIKDVEAVRKTCLDEVRSKDFALWKTIRKDIMHDEVRQEELSFTEKLFN